MGTNTFIISGDCSECVQILHRIKVTFSIFQNVYNNCLFYLINNNKIVK